MEFSLSFTASNKNRANRLSTLCADVVREKQLLDGILKHNRHRSGGNNLSPYDSSIASRAADDSSNNSAAFTTATVPSGNLAAHPSACNNDDSDSDEKSRFNQESTELQQSITCFDENTSHLTQRPSSQSLGDLPIATPIIKQEPSPPYTCTVYKMGHVRVKQERAGGLPVNEKSWKKRYVKLWGTLLYFYKAKDHGRPPLRTLSMQRVEAGLAPEYSRKLRVLRLRAPGGEQLLLELDTPKEMISWIEHLQAAANISMDLDHRKMPKFVTMVRPNNNRFGRAFNIDLGAHQRTVVAICNSRY